MATCPRCNNELNEGAKFCNICGTPIIETIFCRNCGNQTSAEFAFCQNCGASLAETPVQNQFAEVPVQEQFAETPVQEQPVVMPYPEQPAAAPKAKKKLPKKLFIFGGIGVAVIAIAVVVISLIFGGIGKKPKSNYALYLKDREMFFADLKQESAPWQLTSRLVDTEDVDDKDFANARYNLGYYTYISEDGKYIFFPDKIGEGDGFNLYYKEIGNPVAEAVKIDSDIGYYTVNSSATIVTYLKGEDQNLYQYQLSTDSKDKIASEVSDFLVSEDGTRLIYINSEDSIYLKNAGKDKEKIASEISSLEHVSVDCKTVYYIKDGSLYKQVVGQDRVKIDSDVNEVLKIYDSGEIYYLTSATDTISLMDYVTDDLKDSDAAIKEPDYPDLPSAPSRPYSWEYDTYAEYKAAYEAYETAYDAYEAEYDRLYDEYIAAYANYYDKLYRDELRDSLKERTLDQSSCSLCYYNGAEKTVITETYAKGSYSNYYVTAADAAVITYEAYKPSSLSKIKLSEIDSIYDVEDMVEDALFATCETYVAAKGSSTLIEPEKEASYFRINASGTIFYYIDNIPEEENHGDLYRISITGGVVGKPEVYDHDVCTGYHKFVSDSQFAYYKDYKYPHGELYINKEKIDYDVMASSVSFYDDLNMVVYLTDCNEEKAYGTLKVYQDDKAVKIADDVHDYSVTLDGSILYLYDYSLNYYKGELHEWNNGETRKIDDDVAAILSYSNLSNYRNLHYIWW